MSLGSNGSDRVLSSRKILIGLRGMNFCTSSFPFCTEFCKATKQSQMHPNSSKQTKHMSLGSNGVNWVCSLRKNSDGTSWHEVFHQFDPFYSKCCYATKQSQMHQIIQNTPKHEFRVQWGGSGVFVAKIPTRLRGTNFCTRFDPFCIECCMATKESQMHPNSTKSTKT